MIYNRSYLSLIYTYFHSPSDIVSIAELTLIQKFIGQCEIKHIKTITSALKISTFQTLHDTSDNVCLDLQNCCYSICMVNIYHVYVVIISVKCLIHMKVLIYLQPPTFPDMNKVLQIAETATGELFTFSVEDPSKGPDPITCSFLKTIPATEGVFYLLGMML